MSLTTATILLPFAQPLTQPGQLVLQPQEPKSQPTAPTERTDAGTATPTQPGGTAGPQGPGAPPQACGGDMVWMMGLFLVLMWFMVLRPESRRRKETAAMLQALKTGDIVVTIGGMHGRVHSVLEKTIVLTVDEQKMVFDRTAIARVVRDDGATPASGGNQQKA
ncbi:MAG: preprotein translocase subunit YajC [Planctomycetota bacterium]